ncbi:Alpha N-terminal protein methyltransferase 1 [Pseudocyphellaria aurata]|nr:Alpha N-terminal protein methyltransferase 1 [Pseudocyphellaria aurata]
MTSTTVLSPDDQISRSDALKYWNSISPTVNGMLGGYPQISRVDLLGSANFLAKLRRQCAPHNTHKTLERGVDCGAGIGRVTVGFLSKVCEVVDVVEPVEKFAVEIKSSKMIGNGLLGETFVTGLEDWKPQKQYDLIWSQWCLGHLTDKQLVAFFERCSKSLTSEGWIVVKENISTGKDDTDAFDEVDSSVTRTDKKYGRIFEEAGLLLIKTELQLGFPKELYPVRFYALRPRNS